MTRDEAEKLIMSFVKAQEMIDPFVVTEWDGKRQEAWDELIEVLTAPAPIPPEKLEAGKYTDADVEVLMGAVENYMSIEDTHPSDPDSIKAFCDADQMVYDALGKLKKGTEVPE
jgi:hypothetical protein